MRLYFQMQMRDDKWRKWPALLTDDEIEVLIPLFRDMCGFILVAE